MKINPLIIDKMNFNILHKKGGHCWLDEDKKNILHKELYQIQFDNLYANLLISLYDEGHLDFINDNYPNSEVIDFKTITNKIKLYFDHKGQFKKEVFLEYKIWMNLLYSKELRKCNTILFDLFYQYMHFIFEDIKDMCDVLYIDTDAIYLMDNIKSVEDYLYDNWFTFDTINIDIFIITALKRYAYYGSEGIKYKGYSEKYIKSRPIDIFEKIQKEVRMDKINSILDD